MSENKSNTNTTIILIHGTFGNTSCWDGKPIQKIKEIWPNAQIINFGWHSTFPCDSQRITASKQLANKIKQFTCDTSDELILIGFSHGGNVALLVNRYLTLLPDLIVTIGTPMMGFYDSDYSEIGEETKWIACGSLRDKVQVLGSFFRHRGNERIDEAADNTILIENVKHKKLLQSEDLWNKLEKQINGSK